MTSQAQTRSLHTGECTRTASNCSWLRSSAHQMTSIVPGCNWIQPVRLENASSSCQLPPCSRYRNTLLRVRERSHTLRRFLCAAQQQVSGALALRVVWWLNKRVVKETDANFSPKVTHSLAMVTLFAGLPGVALVPAKHKGLNKTVPVQSHNKLSRNKTLK